MQTVTAGIAPFQLFRCHWPPICGSCFARQTCRTADSTSVFFRMLLQIISAHNFEYWLANCLLIPSIDDGIVVFAGRRMGERRKGVDRRGTSRSRRSGIAQWDSRKPCTVEGRGYTGEASCSSERWISGEMFLGREESRCSDRNPREASRQPAWNEGWGLRSQAQSAARSELLHAQTPAADMPPPTLPGWTQLHSGQGRSSCGRWLIRPEKKEPGKSGGS